MDKLIASIVTEQKAQLELIVVLGMAVAVLAVACFRLWQRVSLLERKIGRKFAYVDGEVHGLEDKVERLKTHLPRSLADLDAELDAVLEKPLPAKAVESLEEDLPTEEATITPIGAAEEIRKTSARPPGQRPRRALGDLPQRRLERPGLRPQEKRGPFSGKPPRNPFEDS